MELRLPLYKMSRTSARMVPADVRFYSCNEMSNFMIEKIWRQAPPFIGTPLFGGILLG